ncbi:NfeD family protein [Facilibium subflavum]|uniref:NfeD family protein n=1 Tax=Facilibium subflavum TaxID=2219058 RepID=UPI000E65D967|nr:nodulation protein NfeD [Facilibium subflavum]
MQRIILYLLLLLASMAFGQTQHTNKAVLLNIKGGIGPATQEYVQAGFTHANDIAANLIIIEIDTPGGLAKSMREIIQIMLNAGIPTVVYVYPSGTHAASAGTFLLYAADIAAMAPGTNVGAASPVSIGGMPEKPQKPKDPADKAKENPSTQDKTTLEKKAFNDAAAYIRALAKMHDRNAKWAQEAVTEAKTLTAEEALKENVINVVAIDLHDLLKQIHNTTITIKGEKITLNTEDMQVESFKPTWRLKFLQIITDPSIAYLLLVVGVWLVFLEITNPGLFLPGILGVVCVLFAVYGLHLLPISYVGLLLMFLGIILMIAEAFVTSFGFLAIGGAIAFAIGSVMLVDTGIPGFSIAIPVILAISITTALFFLIIIYLVVRAHKNQTVSGQDNLIGKTGRIIVDDSNDKWVFVNGERWRIAHPEAYQKDQPVKITGVSGFTLTVKSINEEHLNGG